MALALMVAIAAAEQAYDEAELGRLLQRWRDELVVYLLEDADRREFDALETNDQRLEFMRRFWDQRDPSPATPENEFREEHLRRFGHANRFFGAGRPGWRTDRGRLYILLGPPDEIRRNPTGRGPSERPSEVWIYNNPEDPQLPRELALPFVDFFGVGDFELVSDLERTASILPKDLSAPSFNDLHAFAKRRQKQVYLDRHLASGRGGGGVRGRDVGDLAHDFMQFQGDVARAEADARQTPLRELVIARAEFGQLPLQLGASAFRAGGATYLPVTIALHYDELARETVDQTEHYRIGLLAQLRRPDQSVVAEVERRAVFSLPVEERQALGERPLLYQLPFSVAPGAYLLRAVVRDELGGSVGAAERELVIPALDQGLRLSDLMLADAITRIEDRGAAGEIAPFVFGPLRVVPNVAARYASGATLQVYFQVYGLALDPLKRRNELEIRYRVLCDGWTVRLSPAQYPVATDETERAVAGALRLDGYAAGSYRLEALVTDRVSGARASATAPFEVVELTR
jgi:GWxTD domain-containing protein